MFERLAQLFRFHFWRGKPMDSNGPIPNEMVAFFAVTSAGTLRTQRGGVATRTGAGAWALILTEGVALGSYLPVCGPLGATITMQYAFTDGDATHKFFNMGVGGVNADLEASFAFYRIL